MPPRGDPGYHLSSEISTSAQEEQAASPRHAPDEQRVLHYPLLLVSRQIRIETMEILNIMARHLQVDVLGLSSTTCHFLPSQRITKYYHRISVKTYVLGDDGRTDWFMRYRLGTVALQKHADISSRTWSSSLHTNLPPQKSKFSNRESPLEY
jgi:hypothetical protein